jgi:predicted metal-binding membrane protein
MKPMPMPDGWAMSMTWTRMPGQTWLAAGASFVAVWLVMNVAMMMPSLVPMLNRYRGDVGTSGKADLGKLTALLTLGYFFVWTVVGAVVFPVGAAIATAVMHLPALARVVPAAVGIVVLIASALQLSAWKARHLACWREGPRRDRSSSPDTGAAWRHGLRLGVQCVRCSAGPMAGLLVFGVMDLRAMAVVTLVITAERMAATERVARVIGAFGVVTGMLMLARAATLG